MSRLLPLFPLQLVVFPGNDIPLHIFEPRYREMVSEAEANCTEFGLILARTDENGTGIVNVGCTVLVETILQRYDDGRFDVMTRGERRFEVKAINQEMAYLRGEVEFFADDDWAPVPTELRDKAMEAFTELQRAMRELGESYQEDPPDADHPMLGFQLAQAVSDLDFQSQILRTRSETERLRQFSAYTSDYITKQQYVAKMKKAVPTNGFGHKHPAH